MKSLLRTCDSCHKTMNGGVYRAAHICPHCGYAHAGGKAKRTQARAAKTAPAQPKKVVPAVPTAPAPLNVTLTAKSAAEQNVLEVFDAVDAECVLNIELTPDMFADGKFIGAKSEKVKAALQQGKKHALNQLRDAAQNMGANIVTDIAVKNAIKAVDTKRAKVTVRASGNAAVSDAVAEAV